MDQERLSGFSECIEALTQIINGMEDRATHIVLADVGEVVDELKIIRDCDEVVRNLKSQFGDLHKRFKEQIVPEKFQEEGITSITVNGYRYTVSHNSRTSIIADKKPDAYQWLIDNNLGDIISETVNASTLSATARSLLEEGIELPEELFKLFVFENTSITKVK
jgi:hypothetical protein